MKRSTWRSAPLPKAGAPPIDGLWDLFEYSIAPGFLDGIWHGDGIQTSVVHSEACAQTRKSRAAAARTRRHGHTARAPSEQSRHTRSVVTRGVDQHPGRLIAPQSPRVHYTGH